MALTISAVYVSSISVVDVAFSNVSHDEVCLSCELHSDGVLAKVTFSAL